MNMINKYFATLLIVTFTLSINSCTEDDLTEGADYIQKYLGIWSVNDQAARTKYDETIIANP